MLVLRWKYHGERGWKVPPNIRIGKTEVPVGLLSVFLVLLSTAIVNLFTKSVATMSGIAFAAAFFVIFTISERENQKKRGLTARQMKDHFQLEHQDTISRQSLQIKPGGIMVTMRDAANPFALKWTLARHASDDTDIVVLSARIMGVGGPEFLNPEEQSFSEHEQMLFTKAISVAESFGKTVALLVVPAGDIFAALAQSANSLEVDSVVSGLSTTMSAEEQAYYLGQAWEALPDPKRQFNFYVIDGDGQAKVFYIGPHAPNLSPDDVQLVHRLWLNMRRDPTVSDLHHSDIITYALTRLAGQYAREKVDILRDLKNHRAANQAANALPAPPTTATSSESSRGGTLPPGR